MCCFSSLVNMLLDYVYLLVILLMPEACWHWDHITVTL
jgi:hypothetical protein